MWAADNPVAVIVYAIVDLRSSPDHPLGDAVETFVCLEDAERFIEQVRRDDPDLATYVRIDERDIAPLPRRSTHEVFPVRALDVRVWHHRVAVSVGMSRRRH